MNKTKLLSFWPVVMGGRSYATKILSLGPIAYWPLNDLSGAAAVEKVAARNGAYTGVDLAQSQPPFTCPLFDGLNDFCNIYSAGLSGINPKSEGSLSIWGKVANAGVWTDGAARQLFSMVTAGANERIAILKGAAAGTVTFTNTQGATVKTVSANGYSFTTWAHFCMTWSKTADQVKAYLNGAQVGATQNGLGAASGQALLVDQSNIGAQDNTPLGTVWNGWLAHATLFNRALTPTEVLSLSRT